MPRAAPVACLVAALWAVPSLAQAAGPAPTTDAPVDAPAEPTNAGSTDWAPIVWACVGVLFGGVLAVWQIRGLKRGG